MPSSRGRWSGLRRALVLLACGAVFACQAGGRRFETVLTGPALGTTYSVKVISERALPPSATEALDSTVVRELETVNALMSTYLDDSELSRFNAHEGTEPVPLSQATLRVVDEALEISEATGGAYDVTVGPLVEMWGFGPDPPPTTMPSDEEIAAVRSRVGSDRLRLDLEAGTLAKEDPALHLDLSSIAKGYAVDRVAAALEQAGHHEYLVEVGGEIVTRGRNRDGRPWRLAVEEPVTGPGPGIARRLHRLIEVEDAALATSGDYRNRLEIEGETVSHTIDPRTGRPITHGLASVSVLAERCSTADAWATALNVLGPEEGFALAQDLGLAALFLVREGSGDLVELETPAFSTFLAESGGAHDRIPIEEPELTP